MEDDYSSDDDLDDEDDYESFLNDTSEFLLEDLGMLFSDDGSSDYEAMLVDSADDQGSVINLDTSSDEEPGTMEEEEEGGESSDDTETYYDTGSPSSGETADSEGEGDDETMDASETIRDAIASEVQSVANQVQSVVNQALSAANQMEAALDHFEAATGQVLAATDQVLATSGEPETDTNRAEPSTSAARRSDCSDGDEDGQTCLICMEVWSNSGAHRLASLRCGHLFGQSCITRWLKIARARDQRRCPQCNVPASPRDIRLLYARRLVALDTVERDRLREKLDAVERERNALDLELRKSRLVAESKDKQLSEVRARLELAEAAGGGRLKGTPVAPVGIGGGLRLTPAHSLEVNREGGGRVLACCQPLGMLAVSQRSTNNLFSGYGIVKLNTLDFARSQFVFLHTKQIRDLAFSPGDPSLLLSVSLDSCAKVLDVNSNSVVHSFQTEAPLWSCCWDCDEPNMIYAGCQSGCVLGYDIRLGRGTNPLHRLVPGHNLDVSPVVSLASVPKVGVLACHLNSCRFYRQGTMEPSTLPLDGPFVALRYEPSTNQALVSSRPSTRSLRARHAVCELDPDGMCRPIRTFEGSTTQKLMSRPCMVTLPGLMGPAVASYQESAGEIVVWGVGDGKRLCSVPVRDPVLDICPVYANNNLFLGTVSDRGFHVYKMEAA